MTIEHKTKNICIAVGTILLLLVNGVGAIPYEQWNRTFGGTGYDYIYSGDITSDRGFILGGLTDSFGNGAWLIKTDSRGNEEWNKTLDSDATIHSVRQTKDKGYIAAGSTTSAGRPDYWLAKTDSEGNEEWSNSYGGEYVTDVANSVVQTRDRGYLLVGEAGGSLAGIYGAWIVKTDPNGNEEWNKTLGGRPGELNSIQDIKHGDYIIAGHTISNNPTSPVSYAWLIKIDESGNELWNKIFGKGDVGSRDSINAVIQTKDNGYMLAGTTSSYGSIGNSIWMIKTDSDGNEEWNKTFSGNSAYSIQQTHDRGYVLAGDIYSISNRNDAIVIKTDSDGNEEWNMIIGGENNDGANSIFQTSENKYVISGITESYGSGDTDAWLIKIRE